MSDAAIALDSTPPMSQPMRVINTFVAPSKTFADLFKSANCWLALVLAALLTVASAATIDKKVGFDAVVQNQITSNPSLSDRMQSIPADQRAVQMQAMEKGYRFVTYGSAIFVLVFILVETLVLWGAFNFGLGAKTTFPQVFAVVTFAALPRLVVTYVLSIILLFAGVGTDNFDLQNPVGTNLGYYLTESPKWMQTAGRFLDVAGIWSLVLLTLGMAIISRKKVSTSAMIIFGLFIAIVVVVTGVSAAFS